MRKYAKTLAKSILLFKLPAASLGIIVKIPYKITNPIMLGLHKMDKHIKKSRSIYCKIFNMCLAIIWTLSVIGVRSHWMKN